MLGRVGIVVAISLLVWKVQAEAPSAADKPAADKPAADKPPQLDQVQAPVPAAGEPSVAKGAPQGATPTEATGQEGQAPEVATTPQAAAPTAPVPKAASEAVPPKVEEPAEQKKDAQTQASQAAKEDDFFKVENVSLEPFAYSVNERRDPFRSPRSKSRRIASTVEADDGGGAESTVLLPLQQFDVSELRLIGIIWGGDEPQAMVIDPKNTTHMIRVDQRIGRNSGYVASIRENEVQIIEQEEVDGENVKIPRVLSLIAK